MKTLQHFLASFLFAVALAPTDRAADNFKPEPGFVSLFNGKDLSGWCYSSDDKFDGKRESSDARYSAKEGVLTVHSVTPRRVSKIWTTQEFPKNFVLRIEFRAEVNADSGIYLRSPQLQCRDYLVAGPKIGKRLVKSPFLNIHAGVRVELTEPPKSSEAGMSPKFRPMPTSAPVARLRP